MGKMTVSFPLSSYQEGEQQKHTQARTHAGTSRENRMERKMRDRARESWKERGGTQTKNMDENILSLWRWLAHWRFSHRVCITGFKGVCYSSMRIDHWHNFVGATANLVVTCWHSITLPPSAQFTGSFHGEIHFDCHTRLQTQSFCSFPL